MTDDYLSDDYCTCPRCDGWGTVNCHCGGDLCVCENYGDATCPLCIGEGEVSHADEQRYLDARRKWWDEYHAAVTELRHRRSKPATTSKRAKVKAARKQRHRK